MLKNSFKIALISSLLLLFVAQSAFAQGEIVTPSIKTAPIVSGQQSSIFCVFYKTDPNITTVFNYGTCLIKSILPLLIMLAFIAFAWGVTQYILNAQEEAKREKGRQFMIWGLIAIAVITSIWGLVNILSKTFDLKSAAPKIQDIST